MPTAFVRSASEMTSGGANRMLVRKENEYVGPTASYGALHTYMLTCVGLARTPRLLRRRQSCHAVRPLVLHSSLMTTAFSNPRPRTSLTSGELISRIADRNFSPRTWARSESFSSTRTSRAAIATAQPRGFLFLLSNIERRGAAVFGTHPPYVLPCSPGRMQSMMSRSAITADTG